MKHVSMCDFHGNKIRSLTHPGDKYSESQALVSNPQLIEDHFLTISLFVAVWLKKKKEQLGLWIDASGCGGCDALVCMCVFVYTCVFAYVSMCMCLLVRLCVHHL